jgi:hypothetical protein
MRADGTRSVLRWLDGLTEEFTELLDAAKSLLRLGAGVLDDTDQRADALSIDANDVGALRHPGACFGNLNSLAHTCFRFAYEFGAASSTAGPREHVGAQAS